MSSQWNLMILAIASALFFTACNRSVSPPTPVNSASPATSSIATPVAKASGAQYGGQVVEMGEYHLELLAAPEGENMHIDFWLLKSADHAALTDATVTATLQFPNGAQKEVEMTYDQEGKHYKAFVPGFVPGEYRVVVQTDRKGEKVNGRFNFTL
jgi:hypothetical protein